MSTAYEMGVTIVDYDGKRRRAVIDACCAEWGFIEESLESSAEMPSTRTENEMRASAKGWMSDGDSVADFFRRLREAIWRANGRYCEVRITATYVKPLPNERYSSTYGQWEQWRGRKHEESHRDDTGRRRRGPEAAA